jgi:hypothetical protein
MPGFAPASKVTGRQPFLGALRRQAKIVDIAAGSHAEIEQPAVPSFCPGEEIAAAYAEEDRE